ncbi:MAG TPA: hypothetical protein DCG38_09030 [Eubacteriaceae bacterium]|jgi:Fe-only nitrogenase accessory protein AnfO|nr:hypothetical protein [Eubacteriaceae bacterium]
MKIAFCLNNEDKIKSINDWTVIKIYEYNGTVARKVQEIFSNESNLRSIKEKQNFAKKVISSLGDCKMLAASNISGVFFTALECAGFEMWEVEGDIDDVLKSFIPMMDNSKPKITDANPYLIQNEEGVLTFNLKEALIKNPDSSSKKLLLPLLKETSFFQMSVLCGHIPPWFETTLDDMGFKCNVVELDSKLFKAVIEKKVCSS